MPQIKIKEVFYKDIKIIKTCKNCGVIYRPARGSYHAHIGLCIKCRSTALPRLSYGKWLMLKKAREMTRKLSGIKRETRKNNWNQKHPIRHRIKALESYHRCKDFAGNRKRSHHKKKTAV